MTTLVLMADTHGYEHELFVPDGDILVHAGDMTTYGTMEELGRVRDWLSAQPHAHKIIVAGNHDVALASDDPRAIFGPSFIYLQDEGVTLEGLRIWGSPWVPVFRDWPFMLERGAAIDEKWQLIPRGLDLLVTHGPPWGFGDLVDEEHVGCEDLRRRIEAVRPRVHAFGHIHEGPGRWQHGETTIMNVTTAQCTLPCTVVTL